MRRADLQYDLPTELIAQEACEPRDASRLLVVDRAAGKLEHRTFRDIADYLLPGDCLVLNNTRVVPARFFCQRATGGRIEALFLHEARGAWQVLLKGGGRVKVGEHLQCSGAEVALCLEERGPRGQWRARPEPPISPLELLERIGTTPLPPYIRRPEPVAADIERYQTVYAERPGAVAAPTAGLHFTPELLRRLAAQGVRRTDVTLHVGVGTFAPIEAEDLAQHNMHAEWYEIDGTAAEQIRQTRAAEGRVVAVGTTATRVLESLPEPPGAGRGWTDIFIYPPYAFRQVDALLTNFHLPGSTLLALVMAFASPALIRKAYDVAVKERYRFYSYGDAMLIT